jgi:hypothetical protein
MIELKVPKRILALDDEDLKKHIEDNSFKRYQHKLTILVLLHEQYEGINKLKR